MTIVDHEIERQETLRPMARALRALHGAIGLGELSCLAYVWVCALSRRRDRWLGVALTVLFGEGVGLTVARGCPLGILQRRAGDDVPMFELWFGERLAPYAIPTFTVLAVLAAFVLWLRPATHTSTSQKGSHPGTTEAHPDT